MEWWVSIVTGGERNILASIADVLAPTFFFLHANALQMEQTETFLAALKG